MLKFGVMAAVVLLYVARFAAPGFYLKIPVGIKIGFIFYSAGSFVGLTYLCGFKVKKRVTAPASQALIAALMRSNFEMSQDQDKRLILTHVKSGRKEYFGRSLNTVVVQNLPDGAEISLSLYYVLLVWKKLGIPELGS
ncbi:MAG: hypothetical protein ABI273_21995 [Lacunisphaera sp.]